MKNHYFIGKLLNNEDQNSLKGAQNFISRNVEQRGKIFNFNTKFAYIGYLDQQSMLDFLDKFNNIFEAITSKFSPFDVNYTEYGVTGIKTTKKSISILYESSELQNIIVPYIRNYINQITEDDSDFYPHVSLVRIDAASEKSVYSKKVQGDKNILQATNMPKNPKFTLDSIDILKGELIEKRLGQPSKLDEMNITVSHSYKLRGGNNI